MMTARTHEEGAKRVKLIKSDGPTADLSGTAPSPGDLMRLRLRRVCSCGHERDAHEHYRRGTDCATCDCARFRTHLELVLRLGRRPAAGAVVTPEEVPAPRTPWVRPAHSAGTTSAAEIDLTPVLRHHIALPRDGDAPVAEPIHVVRQRQGGA
jgi:hypothetical protein